MSALKNVLSTEGSRNSKNVAVLPAIQQLPWRSGCIKLENDIALLIQEGPFQEDGAP